MINPECQICSLETDMLAQCLWQVKEITHDTRGKGLTLGVRAQMRHSTRLPCSYSCFPPLVHVLCEYPEEQRVSKNTVVKCDKGFVLFMQLQSLNARPSSYSVAYVTGALIHWCILISVTCCLWNYASDEQCLI